MNKKTNKILLSYKVNRYFSVFIILCVAFGFKATAQGVFLPFVDDFSAYQGEPNKELWANYGAEVNRGYQFLPPTIGVVTLDLLDNSGRLYSQAGTYTFAADTLQSKSIRLDSARIPTQKKLIPSDSLYLSFFIQPAGGYGNMWEAIGSAPSKNDSIVLQFYKSNQSLWQTVWSIKGTCVDSIYAKDSVYWIYVLIPIVDTSYFNQNFSFRFINYGSLDDNPSYAYVANASQWNIDYIYLGSNRSYTDTAFRDVAFVDPAPSMIKSYTSVPAKHFDVSMLKDSLDIRIVNLYSSTLNSNYNYYITDSAGNELYTYNGGFENIVSYMQRHQFQTAQKHAKPEAPYVFQPRAEDKFTITHIVSEGVGQDNIKSNDTMRFVQYFGNYFSYDDGTAEAGIGVEPTNNSVLAVGYNLLETDTLYSVDIYFNLAYQQANIKPFYIIIYDCSEDSLQQPNNVVYRNSKLTPVFDSLNKFVKYTLDEPVVLNGRFFVGLQSISKTYLNIGFDQNNDARGNVFEKKTTSWEAVFLKGAPMIRPCFGYKSVSLNDVAKQDNLLKIYPNPAKDYIYVETKAGSKIQLFDMSGRLLIEQKDKLFDVSNLNNGIYIIKANNDVKKLVIAR